MKRLLENIVRWGTTAAFMAAVVLIASTPTQAQSADTQNAVTEAAPALQVYFRSQYAFIEKSYMDNASRIEAFVKEYRQAQENAGGEPVKIKLQGFTSPDGSYDANMALAGKRAMAVKTLLMQELGIADSLITIESSGFAWETLRNDILTSGFQPESHRDQIVSIIDNEVEMERTAGGKAIEPRKHELIVLNGGSDWARMKETLFPNMRKGSVSFDTESGNTAQDGSDADAGANAGASTTDAENAGAGAAATAAEGITANHSADAASQQASTQAGGAATLNNADSTVIVRRLAIKTNMLYDVLSGLNISLEFPISRHFSIEAMYMQPWWGNTDSKMNVRPWTIKGYYGELSFKYWFNKEQTNELKGHHLFLFGAVGNADVRFKGNDYQFDLFSIVGIGYGYNWAVARDWRIGLDLGIGWFRGTYKHGTRMWGIPEGETAERWFILNDGQGRKVLDWIGPVKASVSVTYLIPFRKKVK